jgi:hypothetical protein
MMKTIPATLFLAVLALAAPRAADAQMLRLGLAAGPTMPVAGFSDVVDTGFHVRGLASLRFPLMPLGLRGELAYNRVPRGGKVRDELAVWIVELRERFRRGIP